MQRGRDSTTASTRLATDRRQTGHAEKCFRNEQSHLAIAVLVKRRKRRQFRKLFVYERKDTLRHGAASMTGESPRVVALRKSLRLIAAQRPNRPENGNDVLRRRNVTGGEKKLNSLQDTAGLSGNQHVTRILRLLTTLDLFPATLLNLSHI